MTLYGLTYVDGPLGESGGAVQFAGNAQSYGIIENTADSRLIPVESYTILLQVT